MNKIWRIQPHDVHQVAALRREADLPALVAHLLVCRGITDPREVETFLNPKLTSLRMPEELPGTKQAAGIILEAVRAGQKIVIYGDYDVDGMTSTSILLKCLQILDAPSVDYYIPDRLEEGYGLNAEAVRKLAKQGAELIITVDCGIASTDEAKLAKELGVRMIITDHHKPGPELPDVEVIIHPGLPQFPYPFAGLAGAGVAFKLAWAICQAESDADRVTPRLRSFLMEAVGLAAMGTVADVVPLIDENRVLVREGLDRCLRSNIPLGVRELMKAAGVEPGAQLTSEDIGFKLGPRLNAAGRLGQARLAVELLTTSKEERAHDLADYLNGLNESRQKIERGMQLTAVKQVNEQFDPEDDAALVLNHDDWHPGVIGIVAGRLAERYHRPVVMLSSTSGGTKPTVGSARSVPGFDLHAALVACEEHLLGYGGHAAAAGLQIEDSKIDAFRQAFCEYVSEEWRPEERVAEIDIDGEFPLGAFSQKAVKAIDRLAPFGEKNRRPIFCATGVELAGPPKKMGGGERHFSARLKQQNTTLRAVAFGRGEWVDEMAEIEGTIDIAFQVVLNHFAGRTNVELHLADWRESS